MKLHSALYFSAGVKIEESNSVQFVSFKTRIFVSGGQNHWDEVVASVELFDVITDAWTGCKPMKEKRYSHAMTSFTGNIFVFGGHDGSNNLRTCEKLVKIFGVQNKKVHFNLKQHQFILH